MYFLVSDGNFEKHFQFFSDIGEQSLRSALKEYYLKCDDEIHCNIEWFRASVLNFLEKSNIVLHLGANDNAEEPFDDLHRYHSRLVSSHLMNKVHKLFSKAGDGEGMRAVCKVSTPYFLSLGGSKSKYAKYSFKDNVCYDASSEREKKRSDFSITVNAWGGPNSVDSDEFQEHRIKNIKGYIDSLHGNVDTLNLDSSLQSADLELKISADFDKDFDMSFDKPSHSTSFLTAEENTKVSKVFEELRPFSRSRKSVSFKEPLKEATHFTVLGRDSELVKTFLERNKKQFSTWGPFV